MQTSHAQPAYVLHSRSYKETSALVDLFTPLGRTRAVLRGARGKVGSLVRPFIPLELELRGRGELKNVARLESAGTPNLLCGDVLLSGLYLNELLMRLLPTDDAHPDLFNHYAATLSLLAAGQPLEPLLRAFEWRLLGELGYGFSLAKDLAGSSIQPGRLYRLLPDAGLESVAERQPGVFQGSDLLAMRDTQWFTPGVLAAAKRLMRQALASHLGGRPLVSRELFRKY